MSTHLQDYKSVEGRIAACGRFFADGAPLPRGVAVVNSDAKVSCQGCLGSDFLKKMRAARKPLSDTHCTCGGDVDQPASQHDISCPRAIAP